MMMQKMAVAKGVAIMIADSYKNPTVLSTILPLSQDAAGAIVAGVALP